MNVLLSSSGNRPTADELAAKGLAAALVKPVRGSRLFNTIMEVLGDVSRGAGVAVAETRVDDGVGVATVADTVGVTMNVFECDGDGVLDAVADADAGRYCTRTL